jgi:hypothetical protein
MSVVEGRDELTDRIPFDPRNKTPGSWRTPFSHVRNQIKGVPCKGMVEAKSREVENSWEIR